ncbi:Potassium voltage-gated channel subfamily H member 2 [Ceratobasidium theobromae]|uniref:Potassium voltage-gated channel subfamily H member 2 n=1 Tax=Ceratobasidium theobromae TaxID=1582974 RepID=A0A5N5QEI8_9AGAM|nr:Potassium voltage-gated channel subfamily H member 2 [Ceratobasidium theobromae]
MVLTPIAASSSRPTPYSGPRDGDPLTEAELSLLLAIPRAAQTTPNGTLFRLPLGPDPSLGWVDVTCAETYSIVSRLAASWRTRLSKILDEPEPKVGPGIIICILAQPSVHALFHLFAFWALGCTVQYVCTYMGNEIVDSNIRQSGCKVILYSGANEDWLRSQDQFDGALVELPENEYAHRLAQKEKEGSSEPVPAWPKPQRPTPAVIIQSSASTGTPKLLRFSLYYYTIGHPFNCQKYLSLGHPQGRGGKTPFTHPLLSVTPPFWQGFFIPLFVHLATATPLAIAHISDISTFTSEHLVDWARGLDVGGITCSTAMLRNMATSTVEANAEFLQSMYLIRITGSALGDAKSALFEKHNIPVTNIFGMSELVRLMSASHAPLTHLRPFPDVPPPLVVPVSEPDADGLRQVQLWHTASTSPALAHHMAYGGVPLKLEPFPGEGPHHGEAALNWGDIFQEVRVGSTSTSSEIAYMHIGRADDHIRLGGTGRGGITASKYELELGAMVEAQLGMTPDAVQLFGTGYSCTALVVQFAQWSNEAMDKLASVVEQVNANQGLERNVRVHPGKRMLVVGLDGIVCGPGAERVQECSRLMVTHKRTLQRWRNVQAFKAWLDGLDFGEP